MAVSLPARLAILITVLAGSLLIMLYRVHQATHFSSGMHNHDDFPEENMQPNIHHHLVGDNGRRNMREKKNVKQQHQQGEREMNEQEDEEQTVQEEEEEKNKPPMNILLFYADDWRHDTLGAAGNPIVKTPVLDALAEEGVRFTENCVTTSICWISRATCKFIYFV